LGSDPRESFDSQHGQGREPLPMFVLTAVVPS
ncbi:MAG: hypothetical protein ACI8T1_005214, partial [Verrucomicrobiales bacterium]